MNYVALIAAADVVAAPYRVASQSVSCLCRPSGRTPGHGGDLGAR